MREVEIFIPFMGPSTNKIYAGEHWAKRKKQADLGHSAVKAAGIEPFMRPVHLTFTPVLGKRARARDCSNYSYTVKLIEDGLVAAGVIINDTPDYVKGISIMAPVVNRAKPSGMILYIEEVPADAA